jgi:FkbM family methyltransferase
MKRDFISILKAQGASPRSLLDVGAHLGAFGKSFKAAFPACVPTLIEPNPHCGAELAETGFEVHLVAASDTEGEGELFLTREWLQSTGSSLYRENTDFFRDEAVLKQTIRKARIDDLFRDRQFDFVKIDTQGSELDVLRGGAKVLKRAQYILIEVSLVNYNEGGAKAEEVFEALDQMGFHCTEVTEFHRLRGIQNGGLLQIDVLFEPRRQSKPSHLRPVAQEVVMPDPGALSRLAERLLLEGKGAESLAILEHLAVVHEDNVQILRQLISVLNAEGRHLEAVEKLLALKLLVPSVADIIADVQAQLPVAIEKFNACLARGDVVAAEAFASGFARLVPGNAALVSSAMSCNVALGRIERAIGFANNLLMLDPDHEAANALLAQFSASKATADQMLAQRVKSLQGPLNGQHALVRIRDIHDLAGEILCAPLDHERTQHVRSLLEASSRIEFDAPEGTDLAGWMKHYRLALQALDLPMMLAETPKTMAEEPVTLLSSVGKAMDWPKVQAHARKLGAKVVFSVAADESYVELYARWYIKSVLKYCDDPFLIVVHVIGGSERLKSIAASLGITDPRVIYSGDDFDAEAVTTRCFDTPPKNLIPRPVAHFQSIRFLRLGTLLEKLELPVFVSDIDLLLQRGVKDLLERCADADIVFNENTGNKNPGSRLTANLMLAHPTREAGVMLRFLRAYLTKALGGAEVSRWIDQFALTMARHHVQLHAPGANLQYFDTNSDINNVMYRSFEKNPFRFLSLYHGFDTSTLDSDEAETPVEVAAAPVKARRRKSR